MDDDLRDIFFAVGLLLLSALVLVACVLGSEWFYYSHIFPLTHLPDVVKVPIFIQSASCYTGTFV